MEKGNKQSHQDPATTTKQDTKNLHRRTRVCKKHKNTQRPQYAHNNRHYKRRNGKTKQRNSRT